MDDPFETSQTATMGESSADVIQAGRVLKVVSPLGGDVLLPERATIREGVNQMFEIALSVRAKRADIKPGELIGRRLDVRVEIRQGAEDDGAALGGGGGEDSMLRRPFNALVTSLEEGPPVTRGLRSYRMVLRPEMWLLSRRSDCRIFLDKTSVQICQMLFSEHGLTAPDFSGIVQDPPVRHYSVQWNETDLDYLLRRLQEDGLFWWFAHEEGRHQLIVADHQSGWLKPSKAAEGETRMRIAQGSSDINHIDDWRRLYSYVSGKRSGRDWNFETPTMVPGAETPSMVDLPDNAYRELYEYPARAIDPNAAERAERLRVQAVEADHDRVEAASNIRVVEPGRRFTPYEVAHPDQKYEEHVVLKATHWIVDRSYETAGDEPEYRNEFEAMPSRIPATPHRERPRPQVAGAQVGIIAGPEGEEIHCDKYGRIKLWFPWDRRAKKDGSDTCWVRVSQNWAGGSWGGQIIPRIGMEAMVSFVDGDPDRPLVTSLVPNPQQKVPYDLPANKTRSIIRSNSHKSTGFNEMTFEDATGAENMFFHAQKDQTTRVLNNRTKRVDAHEVASIGGNRAVEVAQNQKTEVGGSMNLTVGGTGAGAMGLMGQLGGMAGQTSGLLQQAGQIAGGGGGGAGLAGFAMTLASSALGFLGAGGLGAREGVVAGSSPRADAGTALAGSGAGMGQDASGLFPMGGIMNTVVGAFKSDSVGVAHVEQIGTSKVTNVGATQMVNVGMEQHTNVGKTIGVSVGKLYKLLSQEKFDGEAKIWEIRAEDRLLLSAPGGYIEINKEGIRIRGLKVDIEGNRINFSRGGPGEGAVCLREMAKSSTPFVRA